MNEKALSKIWIVIIAFILIVGGGILVYQYLGVPKKEVQPPDAKEEIEEIAKWKTYKNEQYQFEIKYLSDWTKQEQVMGSIVAFSSPQESASDIFLENLNVIVQDLSTQPMTLSDYTDLSVDQISRLITDSNIIDSSATTLAGNPAHKLVYTGKHEQHNLKWMQVWTIKNNKVYLISCTAEVDKYSDFLRTIQQMINSFKLT